MMIKPSIMMTVSGQYNIVDLNDEDAPLVSLHNEFNTYEFAELILKALVDHYKSGASSLGASSGVASNGQEVAGDNFG